MVYITHTKTSSQPGRKLCNGNYVLSLVFARRLSVDFGEFEHFESSWFRLSSQTHSFKVMRFKNLTAKDFIQIDILFVALGVRHPYLLPHTYFLFCKRSSSFIDKLSVVLQTCVSFGNCFNAYVSAHSTYVSSKFKNRGVFVKW